MTRGELLPNLADLYETDEAAWLEQMAALAGQRDVASLDLEHLHEYLSDMAKREKRDVVQRLLVLLTHLLKWEHQPEKRSRSWKLTIDEQREELQDLLESKTLRNHAEQEFAKVYQKAVRRAAVETDLSEDAFPAEGSMTLEQALEA